MSYCSSWIHCKIVLFILAGIALSTPKFIHETTRHGYCRCRPLVVTFVCYEFGRLSCTTKLEKEPHFVPNIPETKNVPEWCPLSPDDVWALISWHLSFSGCKRQEWTIWHEYEGCNKVEKIANISQIWIYVIAMKLLHVGFVQVSTDSTQGQAWEKGRAKKKKKRNLSCRILQPKAREGEVGFSQCRLGYMDDSAWFLAEEVTLTV